MRPLNTITRALCLTIVGIPFGLIPFSRQHFKLMRLSLTTFG